MATASLWSSVNQAPLLFAHFTFTPANTWTIAALALSLLLALLLRARGWGQAAWWAALAFAGQACAFQLINAGPEIHLQLIFGWPVLLQTWRAAFLAGVLLQALVVAWGMWRHCRGSAAWCTAAKTILTLRAWVLLASLSVYVCITIHPDVAQALVSGDLPRIAKRIFMHGTRVGLALAMLFGGAGSLLLAASTLPPAAAEKLWSVAQSARRRLPRLAAVWVLAISSVLAWRPLEQMPHVPDEAAYLFQAKYLSTGVIFLPAPPAPEAFPCRFGLVDGDRWYSAMLGGWPFVLAAGVKLGVTWLVNPLLGGLGILLAHLFLRRVYGRDVADGSVALLATSPWLLFISASLMNHALSLVLALLGLLGVEAARTQRPDATMWSRIGGGALAGLAIGALLHVRPLEAVAVAAAAGIWWLGVGWKSLRLAPLAATAVTGLAMTALFLGYNQQLTGKADYAPVEKFFDTTVSPGANRLGFGKDVGSFGWTTMDALPGHGAIDVLMNTNQNLYLVNFETFGWACGSLLFVALRLLRGGWRDDGLMWGLLLAIIALTNLYWFSGGPDFGARYWYLVILPVAVLTVRGAQELARNWGGGEAGAMQRVLAFALLATALGSVNLIAWRATDKYPGYRRMRGDMQRFVSTQNFGRDIIFVRGPDWPDYAAAFALNPPRIDRPAADGYAMPIFALDLGHEANQRVRAYYADRAAWIVAGYSEPGGARVLAGPVAPGSPLPDDGYLPPPREKGASFQSPAEVPR